ncbi:MAG: hypothetical protein U1E29_03455 [Coriobacteriia bacterium]|nr:hypothetical protein [Coriobacteriia bacterium]
MVRINLLPPEIGEKRKYEERIKIVLLSGVAVYFALFVVYGVLSWMVMQANEELQSNRDLASQLGTQAEAFKIFEDKEQDLARRVTLAELALARRVDWGRITNEVSLVLPNDLWLTSMTGDEEEGIMLLGKAVDTKTDMPDHGHKSVAKTLVRLADLELLRNVWLVSSTRGLLELGEDETHPIIDFEISSDVVRPPAPESATTAPAPPTQDGQAP